MSELLELAARVEALTEADREVDGSISLAVYHNLTRGAGVLMFQRKLAGELELLPAFTGSLDAARSLVPEGWRYTVSTEEPGPYAWVGVSGAGTPATMAATPELALVAAALRARAGADE